MQGRFLEFSVAVADIRASLDFYAKLGFSPTDVGDAWPHPYAVITDGRICIGLHQHAAPLPALTFVKADLLKHVHLFERVGVDFEVRHLGGDVFNEVAWRDPSGNFLRYVEARTFSPSKRPATDNSLCGYFLEIALPARDVEAARIYWEQFGFVGMVEADAPIPHVCCMSDTIDVGLYDQRHIRRPTLLFECADVEAGAARIAAAGVAPAMEVSAAGGAAASALFVAPEGTALLISADA